MIKLQVYRCLVVLVSLVLSSAAIALTPEQEVRYDEPTCIALHEQGESSVTPEVRKWCWEHGWWHEPMKSRHKPQ